MRRIGVLALQGDFDKHVRAFTTLGAEAREVRTAAELEGLDGLILPGGESTALTILLLPEMREALAAFCATHPVWGTCAGMILLSRDASDPRVVPFGFLDLEILRNGYGRQVHSFEADLRVTSPIDQPEKPLHGIFIRAPRIVKMGGGVEPLAWLGEDAVCVRQGHFMASSFHPELTDDLRLQKYFLSSYRMNRYSICCDFDGTICIPDCCDYLLSRFADPEWKELDRAVWSGELTEREAFARQIGLLHVTWADACQALHEGVTIREGFGRFVEFCRERELPFTILSGGLRELIAELLSGAGLPGLATIAHGTVIDGERWTVDPWQGKRYAEHCGHCKCSFLFDEQARGRRIIYIGDGYTDLCPAQHADLLFATGNLARECAKTGRRYIPFETFHDIERELDTLLQSEQDLRR